MKEANKYALRLIGSTLVGQLVFQVLFLPTIYHVYTEEFIEKNDPLIMLVWVIATLCVIGSVFHLVDYWNKIASFKNHVFFPLLTFVFSFFVNVLFDAGMDNVPVEMIWINLISSIVMASIVYFVNKPTKQVKEPVLSKEEEKEEIKRNDVPFLDTKFALQMKHVWQKAEKLERLLPSSRIEEKHAMETMQRELHQMHHHYIRLSLSKKEEADEMVNKILIKMEERLSLIEEAVCQIELDGLKKIEIKYQA